jgi:hypothetical protein
MTKSGAGDEWVDVPGFEDVKVGQKYVFKMPNGMSSEWVIAGKSESAFTVEMSTIVNGKELTGPNTNSIPFRVKKEDDKPRAGAPKPTEKETLEGAGQRWECEIIETDGAGAKMRMWRAKKFPFTIKIELNGEPSLELVEIK